MFGMSAFNIIAKFINLLKNNSKQNIVNYMKNIILNFT
jgi:hypothetical protein